MAAAIEGLMLVAERDGPTMFARIGIMRALNRHVERVLIRIGKTIIGNAGSWRGIDRSSGPCDSAPPERIPASFS